MRRRTDVKFIGCVLGGFVVLGAGVHFLHAFQLSRSQALLLRQAERAESKADPDKADYRKAAHYLYRYLGYYPNDTDALARLAAARDEVSKQSNSPKDRADAYRALDQLVRRDPGRFAARRRVAELAVRYGEHAHAKNHLERLVKQFPNDSQLERLMGDCEWAGEKYAEAATWLARSVGHAPDHLESYHKLAGLYRLHLGRPADADRVADEMVAKNPKSPRALLGRVKYYQEFRRNEPGAAERIKGDLAAAEKMGGQDVDLALLGAAVARDEGDLKEARRLLQRGLAAAPQSADLYLSLMATEVKQGDKAAAAEALRRGLRALPEDGRLLVALADLSLQNGDLAEAEKMVQRLGRLGRASDPTRTARDSLRARLLMEQAKWGEALRLLEGFQLKTGLDPDLAHDLDMLLGHCHERLGNPDQALAAFQQALKRKPLTSPARFTVPAAQLRLGRFDEAVAGYREALGFKDAPPRLRLALVRALVARDLQLPEKKRTWAEAKEELDRSANELPGDVEVAVLRAEVQLLEDPGHPERARAALEKARDAGPEKVELWLAVAAVTGHDRPAEALKVLDDAARRPELQGKVELRLARLRHSAGLPEKQARAALAREEPDVLKAEGEEGRRLLAALGDAYLRIGAKREAEAHMRRLAEKQPDNLMLRLVLLDLAMDRGAGGDEVPQLLQQIRRIEGGAGGPFWHFGEAARLYRQATAKDRPSPDRGALAKARQHLGEASKLRPNWSRAPALLAEIDDLEGRREGALDNFRQAVRLGDRRPNVLRQYVRLLSESGQSAEIRQVIGKLADRQEQTLLAAGLGKVAAGALFTPEDPARALELARKTVPTDSKDYLDHLWLGHVLWASGPKGSGSGWKAETEQAFARARDLRPADPETWLVLIGFLRETGQKQPADDVLAQSQKALAEADAARVMGHAREAEGDKEGAEKHFLAAARARPADALMLQNVATFYLRSNQFARAEPYLQQMLSLSDKDAEGRRAGARRGLAVAYAARGNYQYFKKALAALDDNKKSPGETAADVRARAHVLATRAEHRKEAIGLLKQMSSEQSLTEADKWLLARLHDADGDWGQAQAVLLGLLNSQAAKEPAYYAFYVDRLLRRKETALAEQWLEKLEQVAPNVLGTQALRARALAAQRKDAQAVALLRGHAVGHEQDLAQAARAVEDLAEGSPDKENYFRHAEEMCRDLVKRSGKPESHLRLAEFLGRQGRVREALDECERAGSRESSQEAAVAAVAVLRAGRPGPEDYRRVEGWLRAAAEKGQNAPVYLALLADLNDLRGDYRQAIAFNREALRRSPDNVVVLNNLAWLLALSQEGGEEALGHITRAVDVAGPLPALLDTRGTVLLSLRKAALAVPDLEQAVALRPTPGGYYRLARARLATNPAAAAVAIRQAQRRGLRAESLHPLERDEYGRVLKTLAN